MTVPGAEVEAIEAGGGAEAEDARGVRGIVTIEVSMPPALRVGSGKASAGCRIWTSRGGWDGPGTGTSLSRGGTVPGEQI